jgi:predicted TIM-barrel fold metal-dependent hydrolase
MWDAKVELEYLFSLGLQKDELEKILSKNVKKLLNV